MEFEKLCQSLYDLFAKNKFIKILLPLDLAIMFGSLALRAIGLFASIGSFVNEVIFFAFFLGLLITLSKKQYLYASYALAAYAALPAIEQIFDLFRYSYISWANLLDALVYGYLAFMLYKKALAKGGQNV